MIKKTVAIAAAAAALAIGVATPAHAGPWADDGLFVEQSVCERLDADPRPLAIDQLVIDMIDHGLSNTEIVDMLSRGVYYYCPEHKPVWRNWLAD